MVAPRKIFLSQQQPKIKRYTCTHAGSFPMWHHPSDSKTTLSIPGQARPGQPTGREKAETFLAGLHCKDGFCVLGPILCHVLESMFVCIGQCAGKHGFVYWAMYWQSTILCTGPSTGKHDCVYWAMYWKLRIFGIGPCVGKHDFVYWALYWKA